MKNIYEILEFDKILSQLSARADSDDGKLFCENLKMQSCKENILKSLKETESAYSYLSSGIQPSFKNLHSISESLLRLSKQAPLSAKELLNISNLLDICEKIISYRSLKESNTNLDVYFNALNPLKNENYEIKRIIISENEISDTASHTLQAIRRKKMILKEKIRTTANRLLNTYSSYLQEPVLTNKDNTICLPVKSEYKNKIDGVVHSISESQFTLFIEPNEIISLNNEVAENEAHENIEINRLLSELSMMLSKYIDTIKTNYDSIVMLDFIFAKAKFAYDTNATLPIINDKGVINLIDARHPLIDKNKIIPLNIYLGEDFTTLIITGPNTGGKTVALKTVGVITLMALSGLFIPTKENSKIAIFDNIFADIGDEQSIEQSLSTFSSHMTNIVHILKSVTKNSLVLFDEICTGTDPIEGANLAIAILDKLLSWQIRVISTTPALTASLISAIISSGKRLLSRPRTYGTIQ